MLATTGETDRRLVCLDQSVKLPHGPHANRNGVGFHAAVLRHLGSGFDGAASMRILLSSSTERAFATARQASS
jgi:hypothetical protein